MSRGFGSPAGLVEGRVQQSRWLERLSMASWAQHFRPPRASIPGGRVLGSCIEKLYLVPYSASILFSGTLQSTNLAESVLSHRSRSRTCEQKKPSWTWILQLQAFQPHPYKPPSLPAEAPAIVEMRRNVLSPLSESLTHTARKNNKMA